MKHHRFVLNNGLRVILVPIDAMGSATTMVMVGAGSRYEDKENNGISHFLEHMAFKGTKKRTTARQIANLIDGIGAESNAFTGKELTGYFIKSSSNHIELALDILSDMLINSLFDVKEIEKEKGVILEEINLYEDTPARKIGDVFERLLYGDTPMGWDVAGEKDVIKKLSRDNFLSYLQQFYSADNMVVIVAGRLDMKKTYALVEKYFSHFSSFTAEGYPRIKEFQKRPQIEIKKKKTEQAHFALGTRTVGLLNEVHHYPLSILSSILGGGMSSRLFHEVREKRGLAYYVRSFAEYYVDVGYLATFAGVDPKRIDEAIKVVAAEYKKVVQKGEITLSELAKAKQYVKGHFILDLEDTKSVAAFYASSELLEKKVYTPEEAIDKIKKVTLEDINEVAKTYLTPSGLNLAIIGDFEDGARFEKLLE